jgi:membrane protease YdiL (CAAX protease family)
MTQRAMIAARLAAMVRARRTDVLYRWVKLGLAGVLVMTGVVRCPCGGWDAPLIGGVAGTVLFALVARAPQLRIPPGRRIWGMALNAAIDEVVWRGWLTGPAIQSDARSQLAVAGLVLFALVHFPRQRLRGMATHLVSGSVFTVTIVRWGLTAAAAAHFTYNFWVHAARRARVGEEEARSSGRLEHQC